MEVHSLCPLRVGSLLWQPRPPAWELTVVCKATYVLQPGTSVLADEQDAILDRDDPWDDDPARGVRAPSDLLPGKLRTDVTLVGYAYAPGAKPVRSFTARMLVGDVDKSIEVWCDRTFLPDGTLQEGPRITRMHLTWERSAGGPGTQNPIGVRNDARDAYSRRALPNLQPIGLHVSSIDDFIDPVGFGPIAAAWPSRAERRTMPATLGTSSTGSHPESTDLAYFNAAPADQQPEQLRVNERIILENLHPKHARLATNLPGIRPAVLVEKGRDSASWVSMRPDTLWIDTERGIATLTWRGRVPLARSDEPGRVFVALEEANRKVTLPEILQMAMAKLGGPQEPEAEGDFEDDPFMVSTVTISGPIPDEPTSSQGPVMPFKPLPPSAARGPATPQGPGLPFQRAGAPGAPPPSRPSSPSRPANPPPSQSSWPFVPAASDVPAPAPVAAPASVPVSAPAPVPVGVSVPVPVPAPIAPPPITPAAAAPSLAVPAYVMPPPVRPSAPKAPVADSPWALGSPGAAPPLPESSAAVAPAARGPAAAKESADGGALGASNDAAASARPWTMLRRDPAGIAGSPAAEEAQKPVIVRELLQLVWFNPACVARVRRVPSWKKLLEELARKPADKELDDPLAGKEAWEVEDRRELLEVLANGGRIDGQGVEDALNAGLRDDGKYAIPLGLITGDLETPFDELAALKATVTVAAPLAGPSDEGLRAAVEAADKFLQRSNLESAPAAAEGLSTQIREAFAREKKGVPEGSLEAQVERALLAGRSYQKRNVLGEAHLRALVYLPDEPQPLVAYLPQVVANRLPLSRRFRARLLGEIHPAQDPLEKRDDALRALALATIATVKRTEPRG